MAQIKIVDITGNVQILRNADRDTFAEVASTVINNAGLDINFGGADPGYATAIQYGRGMIVRAEWIPNE